MVTRAAPHFWQSRLYGRRASAFAILARCLPSARNSFSLMPWRMFIAHFFAPMPQRSPARAACHQRSVSLWKYPSPADQQIISRTYGIVSILPARLPRQTLRKYKAQASPCGRNARANSLCAPAVRSDAAPILEVRLRSRRRYRTMAVRPEGRIRRPHHSNDKGHEQLVGKNVRTLRTGSGGPKATSSLTKKKWKKFSACRRKKLWITCAPRRHDDNIPGAKESRKSAAELIKKTAASKERSITRTKSQQTLPASTHSSAEQVMMSKQLAAIATDAP